MNYPAASNGTPIGIFIIAPRGGELNLYPPLEGASASGGLKRSGLILELYEFQPCETVFWAIWAFWAQFESILYYGSSGKLIHHRNFSNHKRAKGKG